MSQIQIVSLEPIERVKLARHDRRPYALDFIERIFTDFTEIHGDRKFGDDPAIVAGFANFRGKPVAIVAHQKGRDLKERQARNFGMPSALVTKTGIMADRIKHHGLKNTLESVPINDFPGLSSSQTFSFDRIFHIR